MKNCFNNISFFKLSSIIIKLILIIILAVNPVFLANANNSVYQLPNLNTTSSQSKIVGQKFLRILLANANIIEDIELNFYLKNIVKNLAVYTDLNLNNIVVLPINDLNLNAFALPGGIIGINVGSIFSLENEAELAAILAHEIGHVSLHHHERIAQANKTQILSILLAITGTVLIGAPALLGIPLGTGYYSQNRLSLSRGFEEEADKFGYNIFRLAGYNSKQYLTLLEYLSKIHGHNFSSTEYLLTHPLPQSRYNAIKTIIIRDKLLINKKSGIVNTLSYQIMKARLTISKQDDNQRNQLIKLELKSNDQLANYKIAYAYLQNGQFNKAKIYASKLLADKSYNQYYYYLLADILIKGGESKQAINLVTKYLSVNPDNVLAQFYLSEAYSVIDPSKSIEIIKPIIASNIENIILFKKIIRYSNLAKDKFTEYFYSAELMQLKNEFDLALVQSKFAEQFATIEQQKQIKEQQKKIKFYKKLFDNN